MCVCVCVCVCKSQVVVSCVAFSVAFSRLVYKTACFVGELILHEIWRNKGGSAAEVSVYDRRRYDNK